MMANNKRINVLSLFRSSSTYVLAIVGFLLIFNSATHLVPYYGAGKWPSTKGIVRASEVQMHPLWRFSFYEPRLLYTYTVDGKIYTDSTVRIGQAKMMWTKKDAEDLLEDYHLAKIVTVYYKPADPTVAILEHKIGPTRYQGLILGFGLVIAAMLFRKFIKK